MSDIDRILSFWLDEIGPAGWYEFDDAVDKRIVAEFSELWNRAMDGELAGWCCSARGTLAFLILTDQFPRNMFRGTGQAFASDRLARRAAKLAIQSGFDMRTAEPERQFFYLPLMHSEVLTDQERCVRMFLTRLPVVGPEQLGYAVDHRSVIRKFGRFPSRNAALGRTDSAAELTYRAEGGYMS